VIAVQKLCFVLVRLDDSHLKDLPFNPDELFDSLAKATQDIYIKTNELEDFTTFARAYNLKGEWLYKNEHYKEAVNYFCGAHRIMKEAINANSPYKDLIFMTKVTQNIGNSFFRLGEYSAALSAYITSCELSCELYEDKNGEPIPLLMRISELYESIGDITVRLINSEELPADNYPPQTYYEWALEAEDSLYNITKDVERFIERKLIIKTKISQLFS
jgi:tetratricopeptide (TPR) repeat protein